MTDKQQQQLIENSIGDISKGYTFNDKQQIYSCLFCSKQLFNGEIFSSGSRLLTAEAAMKQHIQEEHNGVCKTLLSLEKEYTGLSEIQNSIITLMEKGLHDKEIAKQLGNKSESTIRNHRFQLRKKEREAKIFLAIMEACRQESLLQPLETAGVTGSEKAENITGDEFITFDADLPINDDRIIVTVHEASKVYKKFFTDDGKLIRFPMKQQKTKLIILQKFSEDFRKEQKYSEKEVNSIISLRFDDYVTIRRYLVEYGFLARTRDNATYWKTL